MVLTLTIENETSLPNGAPVSIRLTEGSNLDIGRSANIDWSLPDASRFISSKHCEVRYRDNGYWLYDVSTNGTFINDDTRRMQAPHRLRHGDRVTIGPYVIFVTTEGEDAEEVAAPIWPETAEPAPPPQVITEVAPRSSASAFGLELDRQINFAAPIIQSGAGRKGCATDSARSRILSVTVQAQPALRRGVAEPRGSSFGGGMTAVARLWRCLRPTGRTSVRVIPRRHLLRRRRPRLRPSLLPSLRLSRRP